MIRVSYKDVNYHRQFSLGPGGRSTVEIEVYEPTTSMKDIEVGETRMAFQMSRRPADIPGIRHVRQQNKTSPNIHESGREFSLLQIPGDCRASGSESNRSRAPAMPLVQAPLESPDGQNYYSLYPLKPGVTSFEVQQVLPYSNRTYAYRKEFYQDIASMDIGVMPSDMALSGQGLTRISTDAAAEFFDLPERARSKPARK